MARSHHRKKHKSHVRQFRRQQGSDSGAFKRSSTFPVFTIIGGLLGTVVGYIATSGEILWVAAGLIAGAAAGYFLGRKVDADGSKKE
jgi:hypothetical protein